MKKVKNKLKRGDQFAGWVLVLPSMILITLFMLYPIVRSFILSFQDYNALNPDGAVWVGLQNYQKAFHDPVVKKAFLNTFIYTLFVVPGQLIFGMALAILVESKLKGKTFFRVCYYLPSVTSTVAIGIMFMFLLKKDGLVNKVLELFGIEGPAWFSDVNFALPSVIIMAIWTCVGMYFVIYMAALQNIPNELYEAAMLDGANSWQRHRYVTIPMLKNTTFMNLVLSIIGCLQMFDQSYVVSANGEGGPLNATMTVVLYIYQQAFKNMKMGYACAIAFVLCAVVMIFTVIQRVCIKDEVS